MKLAIFVNIMPLIDQEGGKCESVPKIGGHVLLVLTFKPLMVVVEVISIQRKQVVYIPISSTQILSYPHSCHNHTN